MNAPLPQVQAPLQVAGVCGSTTTFLVNNVLVSFSCLPPVQPIPPEPGEDFKPGDPAPPNTADIAAHIDALGLNEDLLASADTLDALADPIVVEVPLGTEIAVRDLGDVLEQARSEGRALRLEVSGGA